MPSMPSNNNSVWHHIKNIDKAVLDIICNSNSSTVKRMSRMRLIMNAFVINIYPKMWTKHLILNSIMRIKMFELSLSFFYSNLESFFLTFQIKYVMGFIQSEIFNSTLFQLFISNWKSFKTRLDFLVLFRSHTSKP